MQCRMLSSSQINGINESDHNPQNSILKMNHPSEFSDESARSTTLALRDEIFALFKVGSFRDLHHAYCLIERKEVASGLFNPLRADSLANKTRACLTAMDPEYLHVSCQDWRRDTLWSFNCRALGYLLYLHNGMDSEKSKGLAQAYAADLCLVKWFSSIADQEEQTKLARVWSFLVNEAMEEAIEQAESIRDRSHKLTALALIDVHKKDRLTRSKRHVSGESAQVA
jgi:hypothetical protein